MPPRPRMRPFLRLPIFHLVADALRPYWHPWPTRAARNITNEWRFSFDAEGPLVEVNSRRGDEESSKPYSRLHADSAPHHAILAWSIGGNCQMERAPPCHRRLLASVAAKRPVRDERAGNPAQEASTRPPIGYQIGGAPKESSFRGHSACLLGRTLTTDIIVIFRTMSSGSWTIPGERCGSLGEAAPKETLFRTVSGIGAGAN
jgi:hypothetical protein